MALLAPAGSMKPQLAAIAAGSASRIGSAPIAATSAATTGMILPAAATLLANSVTTTTKPTRTSAMIGSGTAASGSIFSPSQPARPDLVMPMAVYQAAAEHQDDVPGAVGFLPYDHRFAGAVGQDEQRQTDDGGDGAVGQAPWEKAAR